MFYIFNKISKKKYSKYFNLTVYVLIYIFSLMVIGCDGAYVEKVENVSGDWLPAYADIAQPISVITKDGKEIDLKGKNARIKAWSWGKYSEHCISIVEYTSKDSSIADTSTKHLKTIDTKDIITAKIKSKEYVQGKADKVGYYIIHTLWGVVCLTVSLALFYYMFKSISGK